MEKRKTVLVGVLGWGLGHATRCTPVIRHLNESNVKVIIASSGDALELLKKEFPGLLFHELPPYNIWYGKGSSQVLPVLMQGNKINAVIKKEQKIIRHLVDEYCIDKIISDNCYGCYSTQAYSVIITHQTGLFLPGLWKALEPLAHKWIGRQLNHFNECWIPDVSEGETLSGKLSHHYTTPVSTKFIGPLTRFRYENNPAKQYDVLAILSGPEPQRSMLEEKLISQFKLFPAKKFILVAGNIKEYKNYNIDNHIEYLSYADSKKINELISLSDVIISRSGYSTVMDLHHSNKKIIFFPTPGQPEQEYLAQYLSGKKSCVTQTQSNMNLQHAFTQLEEVNNFYFDIEAEYKNALDIFLNPGIIKSQVK